MVAVMIADRPAIGSRTSLPRKLALSCALAIALAAAGWAARGWLEPSLGDRAIFLFFVPAVVAAAALGGLWPGALATILGALAGWRLGAGREGDLIEGSVFLATCAAVVTGGEWFQRARARTEAANRDLAAREAHLQSILDTVPDAMIVIDERGLVRSFSPAAERLFRMERGRDRGAQRQSAHARRRTGRRTTATWTLLPHRRAPDRGHRAASWSANGGTAPPSQWSWPWARCAPETAASSQASSGTSPIASEPRRACRSFKANSCTFHG
jgi:PAS domain-containing protein